MDNSRIVSYLENAVHGHITRCGNNYDQDLVREFSQIVGIIKASEFSDRAKKREDERKKSIEADQKAIEIIEDLLREAYRCNCAHENTYRGGLIWEICKDCGAKWADDLGGKPEFSYPKCIIDAEAFLKEHKPAVSEWSSDGFIHVVRMKDGQVFSSTNGTRFSAVSAGGSREEVFQKILDRLFESTGLDFRNPDYSKAEHKVKVEKPDQIESYLDGAESDFKVTIIVI